MKNLDIKKGIERATRRIEDFRIELVLWHGDGTGNDIIYNELLIYDNKNTSFDTIYNEYFAEELQENDENIKILKKEQIKLHKYLIKHFNSKKVIIKEMNV